MIRKSLITTLFKGFNIQRWNDKIRPAILTEIDKNAHKMIIAYCLAKYEEKKGTINWHNIIKGGIFEFFRRLIISDIKSPIYTKIKSQYPAAFKSLNKWVFSKLKHIIDDKDLKEDLEKYLLGENSIDEKSGRILSAAHIYASYWEFKIIKQANPEGYEIREIESLMLKDISNYLDLEGMQKIITRQTISGFIDLVGQLRFQIRWGQTLRVPETSVLGHSMFVATLCYLFSRELKACDQRIRNNFFGGLFHDLPEALTRDIISPVKSATPEMPEVIKKIESELAEKELYKHLEPDWKDEMSYYITDFDKSKISSEGSIRNLTSDEINRSYNNNTYNPLDGEFTKAADEIAAFVEAYMAKEAGINTKDLEDGLQVISGRNKDKIIAEIDISAIYADF